MAEAHSMNLDEHFVRTRILNVRFFNGERLVRSACDSSVDFHLRFATVIDSKLSARHHSAMTTVLGSRYAPKTSGPFSRPIPERFTPKTPSTIASSSVADAIGMSAKAVP